MKTGGINIRPMRAADSAAVAGMTRALADFHRDGTSVGEAHLLAHCLGPNTMGSVLVATAGKRLVGFRAQCDCGIGRHSTPGRSSVGITAA